MNVTLELRLKGLCHEDFFVRCGVMDSFQEEVAPGVDATKAAIDAINRYGWEEAFEWPHMLKNLPHDHSTIEWLFQQLGERSYRAPKGNMRVHLADWFAQAPVELIAPNLDRFKAAITRRPAAEKVQLTDHLEEAKERVQFASQTDIQCLARLERTFAECHQSEPFPHDSVRRANQLCERLARSGDPVRLTKLVSKWLAYDLAEESSIHQWRAGIAIRLAGLLQYREAAPRLIDMFDADWDWWNEEIETALTAMADKKIVGQIVDQFIHLSSHAQLYISGALTKARFKGLDKYLVRLLEFPTDDLVQLSLGKALALYGTPSSMAAARKVLKTFDAQPDASQIIETLYAFYRLLDSEPQPPELARWERVLETQYQRFKSIELARN